ncbi:MAG: stage V sporulation protein AE [Bacillaceae bacterium]|nr:stage V sporulation protein AE [Bacillaceae bacterium]
MGKKRRVIMVSDGDKQARLVVEYVASKIGGRTISLSAGNPTPLSGEQLVDLIQQTPYDPVFVMFDDNGREKKGAGEQAMEIVAHHPDIQVIGAIAVASNTRLVEGVCADYYVNNRGEVVTCPVNKYGEEVKIESRMTGDTVDILNRLDIPVIVGIGDIGKMEGHDRVTAGAPITTRAVQIIMDKQAE